MKNPVRNLLVASIVFSAERLPSGVSGYEYPEDATIPQEIWSGCKSPQGLEASHTKILEGAAMVTRLEIEGSDDPLKAYNVVYSSFIDPVDELPAPKAFEGRLEDLSLRDLHTFRRIFLQISSRLKDHQVA